MPPLGACGVLLLFEPELGADRGEKFHRRLQDLGADTLLVVTVVLGGVGVGSGRAPGGRDAPALRARPCGKGHEAINAVPSVVRLLADEALAAAERYWRAAG